MNIKDSDIYLETIEKICDNRNDAILNVNNKYGILRELSRLKLKDDLSLMIL